MLVEKILKGHELFATLTVKEIHMLSDFTSEKEYRVGETIFDYNKPCSHFYMLKEGTVYLLLPANPPEFSFAIAKIEKGELFGLSPLLKADRYTSTAKCYEPTKVLQIEAKPFLEILHANSMAGLDVINRVAVTYYARYLNVLKKLQDVVSQVSMVS